MLRAGLAHVRPRLPSAQAPLAAYLRQRGVRARIEEYFLDNRVGRPDPRTFSDPRYYSDVLLEVVALEE